jgi:polar amino acid transport system substrate-binding protein
MILNKWLLFILFISFISKATEIQILSINEPPANYINDDNLPDGYVTEIIKVIQDRLNDTGEIVFVPEAHSLHLALSQPNVLLFSISKTAFREDNFHWIGTVMTKKWHVYALSDASIKINQLSDLKNVPLIGVVRGDVREEWLVNKGF